MCNPHSQKVDRASIGAQVKYPKFIALLQKLGLGVLALALIAALAPSASAQTNVARFRPTPFRLTIPTAAPIQTSFFSNYLTFNTNTSANITFNLTGLPANVDVAYVIGNGTNAPITNNVYATNNPHNVFPYFIQGGLTNVSGTPNTLTLYLTYSNVAPGTFPLLLTATGGATGNIPLILHSAFIWNGNTNARSTGYDGAWGSAGNWVQGTVPTATDEVVFTDMGGQTNIVYVLTNTITSNTFFSFTTNIIISGVDRTVASLRFAQTNDGAGSGFGTAFHSVQIDAGRTLNITGTNGFSLFPDIISGMGGDSPTIDPTFVYFQGAGSLIVSNPVGSFTVQIPTLPGNNATMLNMSNLNNFKVDVRRISLGDYIHGFGKELYDNYNDQNQIGGSAPSRMVQNIYLAKTNIIRATMVDPFNYTNGYDRSYSLTISDSARQGNGGGVPNSLFFGISNLFQLDSICFGGAAAQDVAGGWMFNPRFATNNPSAVFRGPNGGRMSMFTLADTGGTNNIGPNGEGAANNTLTGNTKAIVNFSASRGTVDILVDRLYLARDRVLCASNQTPKIEAELYIGRGIVDANNVILGFQEQDGKTNWRGLDGVSESYANWTQARLQVTNGGTFKVNNNLTLGWTADSNPNNAGNQYCTFGQFSLSGGSTAMVNYVNCDPGLGLSWGNQIGVSNFSTFILSNTICDPSYTAGSGTNSVIRLDRMAFVNGSTLTLHLDGNRATPYIYVTNLTGAGPAGNLIRIAAIANPTSLTYPATVDLIDYKRAGTVNFGAVAFPPYNVSVSQTTSDNLTPGLVQLTISTNPPKRLSWRGSVNENWSTALGETNWFDLDNLVYTNFDNSDYVTFEDNVAYPTNIQLVTPGMVVSGINVTNSAVNHNFINSGGNLVGSATLTNRGTAKLTIDVPTQLSVQHLGGALEGMGDLADVTASAGTDLRFSGSINGGLTTAGRATLLPPGGASLIQGGVVLSSSATFTNYGIVQGGFTVASGTTVANSTVLNNTASGLLHRFGARTLGTNTLLINSGTIGAIADASEGFNNTLTTSGQFQENGGSVILTTLTIGGGNTNGAGLFKPGGPAIGTTTILQSGVDTGIALLSGRLIMQKNSTNVFTVNTGLGGQKNTMIDASYIDFGGAQSSPAYNGCTLWITNMGPAYTPGQQIRIGVVNGTQSFLGSGNASNTYPRILPSRPQPISGAPAGHALAWDLSSLLGSHIPSNGIIKIRSVATNATNLTVSYLIKTNYGSNAANTVFLTNRHIIAHLVWPTNYIGWALEEQSNNSKYDANNPAAILGISTNWSLVFRSVWTNDVWLTNDFEPNRAAFYRMIFPVPDHDLIGISQ